MANSNRKVVFSNDRRIHYAHTFGMRASNEHIYVDFGTEQPSGTDDSFVNYSDCQVIMTPFAAKVLSHLLHSIVESLENDGQVEYTQSQLKKWKEIVNQSPPKIRQKSE